MKTATPRGGTRTRCQSRCCPSLHLKRPQIGAVTTSTAELSLVQHSEPTLDRCAVGLEVSYAYARLTPDTWESGWTVPVDAQENCAITSLTLNHLIDNQFYAVSVRAIDTRGTRGPPSPSAWFRTERNLPPETIEAPTLELVGESLTMTFVEPDETNTGDRVMKYASNTDRWMPRRWMCLKWMRMAGRQDRVRQSR